MMRLLTPSTRLLFATIACSLFSTFAAAEVMRFKSAVMHGKWSTTIPGTLTLPAGNGPHPVVIFLHPCAGLVPPVRAAHSAYTAHLAQNGFATFVLDSFGPRNLAGGTACKGPDVVPAIDTLTDDAFNAMAALKSNSKIDAKNIFLVGQSLGASAAVKAAVTRSSLHDGVFRAIAAYYPGNCRMLEAGAGLRSALLILGAGRDDWTPVAGCQNAKRREGLVMGAAFDVVVYADALHGFDQPGVRTKYLGHSLGYDAKATADGRRRLLEFFKQHLATAGKPK